jgi:hypothetical protein
MMTRVDEMPAPTRPAITVVAPAVSPASSPVLVAFEALRSESVFVGPRVGIAGERSRQSRYFRVLLADRLAPELFVDLWNEASTPAGQLYALAGLYLTNRTAFRRLSPILARAHTTVSSFIGCIVSNAPVADVVEWLTKEGLAREFLPDRSTAREDRLLDSLETAAKLRSLATGS